MKIMGFSAVSQNLRYIAQNADAMYLADVGTYNVGQLQSANGHIVSCNVSGADFTIASGAAGPVLTVGAKNSQTIHGSGNATHLYLVSTSGARFLLNTTVSAQVLSSGNTVNVASFTVTALASATNS